MSTQLPGTCDFCRWGGTPLYTCRIWDDDEYSEVVEYNEERRCTACLPILDLQTLVRIYCESPCVLKERS